MFADLQISMFEQMMMWIYGTGHQFESQCRSFLVGKIVMQSEGVFFFVFQKSGRGKGQGEVMPTLDMALFDWTDYEDMKPVDAWPSSRKKGWW